MLGHGSIWFHCLIKLNPQNRDEWFIKTADFILFLEIIMSSCSTGNHYLKTSAIFTKITCVEALLTTTQKNSPTTTGHQPKTADQSKALICRLALVKPHLAQSIDLTLLPCITQGFFKTLMPLQTESA